MRKMESTLEISGQNFVVTTTQIDQNDLDILKEIGNIGSGHAATSLSEILNQDVQMDVPAVYSMSPNLLNKYCNMYDVPTTAVLMQLASDNGCDILLLFEIEEAKKIATMMTMAPSTADLDPEMEESAIRELANIIIGSFLSAISDFSGISLMPTPPIKVVNTLDAILDNFLVKQAVSVDKALVFDTCFKRFGENAKSILIIFPSPSLQSSLIRKSRELLGSNSAGC